MTKSLKEAVKKDLKEKAEKELMVNEILIGYYEQEIEAMEDKEMRAKVQLKKEQIQQTHNFNKKFLEYVKSL